MFDEQVVRLEPKIRPLLDQFVCVRMIQGNGMDLSLFQFDYDLTFAAFFLNSDRTIYGRYGSRSGEQAGKDVSVEGFGRALERALELQKGYPGNKEQLAGKQPRPALVKQPEDFPSLKGKYGANIDFTGKVVASCIHCHMIRESERLYYRNRDKKIPEEVLFPYPMPDALGVHMNPERCATVESVKSSSPAQRAGFQAGDEIQELNGQRLISTADIQWILEGARAGDLLTATVSREGQTQRLKLALPERWREQDESGWRVGNWDMRRMAFGGMFLKAATEEERTKAGIPTGKLALRAEHVGEYGEHAVAKKAGLQKGDIITSVAGDDKEMTEAQAMALVLDETKRGDPVKFRAKRGSSELEFEIKAQ